ncbi:hypothetical protein ACUOA5_13580, partial [Escherichia coli]
MSQFFYIHPDNPQQRLINQAVEIATHQGKVVTVRQLANTTNTL